MFNTHLERGRLSHPCPCSKLNPSSDRANVLPKYESGDGTVYQRTELTESQKRILFLLKIAEPAKILDISLLRGAKT